MGRFLLRKSHTRCRLSKAKRLNSFFAKEDPDVTESEENEDASEHILKSWPEAML